MILDRAPTSFEQNQKAGSHVAGDLELDRSPSLLLNDYRASPDLRSGDHIADSDLDQVTAAKLAVDRQIEQGTAPDASLAMKEEADGPDLLLGQWTLRADCLASIPSRSLSDSVIELRMAPCEFSSALIGQE